MPVTNPDSFPGARPPLRPGPTPPLEGTLEQMKRSYPLRVMFIVFALGAYLCTVVVAAFAPHFLAADSARQLMVALPLLALLLLMFSVVLAYFASDEYVRHRILKCAAFAGVILAFSTLGYFWLEVLGHARLSMIWVNLYGWAVFIIPLLWVLCRAR